METAQVKTHWKRLSHPLYIGAYELMVNEKENKELVVKIESVKREMVQGPDCKKEECTIMTIPPHKPMILNATNQKALTKAIGSPFIEDWGGKTVTLYVAKVKAFGETLDALRIRDVLPQFKKPEFTPEHTQWQSAIEAVKNKTNTADNTLAIIAQKYTISEKNAKLIRDAAI